MSVRLWSSVFQAPVLPCYLPPLFSLVTPVLSCYPLICCNDDSCPYFYVFAVLYSFLLSPVQCYSSFRFPVLSCWLSFFSFLSSVHFSSCLIDFLPSFNTVCFRSPVCLFLTVCYVFFCLSSFPYFLWFLVVFLVFPAVSCPSCCLFFSCCLLSPLLFLVICVLSCSFWLSSFLLFFLFFLIFTGSFAVSYSYLLSPFLNFVTDFILFLFSSNLSSLLRVLCIQYIYWKKPPTPRRVGNYWPMTPPGRKIWQGEQKNVEI